MKKFNKLSSVFFWALFGFITLSFVGFAPLGLVAFQFMNFIKIPIGAFGMNTPLTPEQIDFANDIENKFKKALHEVKTGLITEAQFDLRLLELKSEIAKYPKSERIESIESKLNDLHENFKSFVMDFEKSKTQNAQPANDYLVKLKSVLDKMVEQIKDGTRGNSRYSLVKQVGPFTGANVAAGIPQPQYDPGVNDTPKRTFVLRSLSNVGTIGQTDTVKWIEKVTGEGGADMTAEGAAKSQVDWDYNLASAEVKKITDFIKISEEMLSDLDFINSEINNELSYLIDKKEEDQLLAGTGLTKYLNGITKYAQTLDLASLNGTVPLANEIDCLGAAITQIFSNMEGAIPTAIVLNPVDKYILKYAQKDADGNYLMPTFFMADGTQVDGVKIYTSTAITAGYFLVADMTKFHIKDREPLRIEFGWENDDFTKNFVTIRGEKRLVSYVKANDTEAFIYDTFVNAKAFLTAAS